MKKSSVICLLAFLLIGCRSAGKQAADAVPVSAPPPQQAYAATLFRATLDSGDSGRLQFAMAALALNERVGEANERLREAYAALLAGNDKLQPSETMTPEHAVLAKWAMRGWLRIHYMFGDWSSFHPGRLAPDVQEKLHELFWNYGCAKSSIRRASAEFALATAVDRHLNLFERLASPNRNMAGTAPATQDSP